MRRLTTFIAVIFAAAAFAPLRAQSLDAFKERLAAPVVSDAAFGTARVTVTEYGDAEKAVDDASRVGQRLRLRGYRVCIFFDNGQDARAGAFAAEALFKETYPGIMVYPVYENPYFKVAVGNCLTAEEAIIRKAFPRAVILFPIADKRLRLREEGAGNSLKRYLIFPILKGLRAGGSALHALIAAEQHKQGDCGIAAPGGQHAVHIRRV